MYRTSGTGPLFRGSDIPRVHYSEVMVRVRVRVSRVRFRVKVSRSRQRWNRVRIFDPVTRPGR